MLKFLLDIFCNDTMVGLRDFEDIKAEKRSYNPAYKNFYTPLFKEVRNQKVKFSSNFIDPIACRL